MLNNLLTQVLGSKNDRLLKKLQPIVAQINGFEPAIKKLSDDELENLTDEQIWAMAEAQATDRLADIADSRPEGA